jgi:hypothetical protein
MEFHPSKQKKKKEEIMLYLVLEQSSLIFSIIAQTSAKLDIC